MIAKGHLSGINEGARVTRVQPVQKPRDSKTLHGEGAKRRTAIMANAPADASAIPFRFDTPRTSSGFVTQAIAQAMRVPKGTPLEVARCYEPAPDQYRRLIRFA